MLKKKKSMKIVSFLNFTHTVPEFTSKTWNILSKECLKWEVEIVNEKRPY